MPKQILFIFVLFATTAWPQVASINGEIAGTVTDPSGAVVADAPVAIENLDTGLKKQAKTNNAGLYRFPLLPLGRYKLTVSAQGFQSQERTGLIVTAGVPLTVNVAVNVTGVSNTVNVTEGAPAVDPSRVDVGNTVSNVEVQNLPLVSRNPFNFILLQPNVAGRPNTEFGVPRKINANGFDARINYQIDGGNNTESDRAGIRLTPFSNTFIQEIQSVNNGFAPEFGDTVGTIFNAITKSGTNQLHGEAAYFFRRTGFSARPKLLKPNAVTPITNVDDIFGNAGGAIVKDKLFYFAGVEHVTRDLPTVVTVTPSQLAQLNLPASYANAIPFSQHVLFFLGKLDYQLNEKNRFSLRFNGHRNDSPYNNGGGLVTLPQTYNFIDRSYAGSFQLISTISPQALNELRIQVPYRLQRQLPYEATGTGPSITVSGIAQFGGSPNIDFIYKEVTPEISDNFTYLLGTHSLKAGFSYRAILDSQTQSNSITYTFPNIQSYLSAASGSARTYSSFSESIGQPRIDYTSNFYSGFLQDNWKPRPNVTLIYGARYDFYNPPSANRNAPYPLSRSFNLDKNNVSPRIGLAIGLGKNQRTVIRGSAGMFYDAPPTDIYRKALLFTGSVPPINFSVNPSGQFAPAFPNVVTGIQPRQNVTTVAGDFANLYSLNANFSVERALTSSTGLAASYFYTRGNRLPVYLSGNLVPSGRFLADGRPVYRPDTYADPQFGNVLVDRSIGRSVYNALNVTFRKRMSSGLELFATYTWSHAIDNAPEQNNIDSGSLQPEDSTDLQRERGNSLTDRRHAFTASGVWQPDFHIDPGFWRYLAVNNQLSALFTAYAGDIFNIGSNQNLNNDSQLSPSLQRPLFVGRNTYLGPPTYQLDLRYSRLFPIHERLTAQFFVEFTNLFNHDNITGVNTTARVNAAGSILVPPSFAWTSALDQRLLQLGIRAEF